MDEIIDGLWISDIRDAREEPTPADSVVTVCQESIEDNVGCEYHWFNMADGVTELYGGECNYDIFSDAVDCVLECYETHGSVLVHCHAGRSRSASVCIAAVAVLKDVNYDEAYNIVEAERSIIHPDGDLVDQARRYIDENTEHTPLRYD